MQIQVYMYLTKKPLKSLCSCLKDEIDWVGGSGTVCMYSCTKYMQENENDSTHKIFNGFG